MATYLASINCMSAWFLEVAKRQLVILLPRTQCVATGVPSDTSCLWSLRGCYTMIFTAILLLGFLSINHAKGKLDSDAGRMIRTLVASYLRDWFINAETYTGPRTGRS